MAVVYKLHFKGSSKFYVGSADVIDRREKEHRRKLSKGTHNNYKLQRMYNKYGDFYVEILEECERYSKIQREQDAINVLQPWINISKKSGGGSLPGKDNPNTGVSKSEDHRLAISLSLTGRVFTQEHCINISKSKNDICPPQLKGVNKGMVVALDRDRNTLRVTKEEFDRRYDLGGNGAYFIVCVEDDKEFGSISKACKYYGMNDSSTLESHLRTGYPDAVAKRKFSGGLHFKKLERNG